MLSRSEIASRITRNPGIYGGKPIIRGTRMPVELINDFFSNGATIEEIVDDYPDLTREDVEAAIAFASLNESEAEAIAHRR